MTVAPDALAVGDTVPQAEPVQLGPETVHVTPRFAGSFDTVATSGNVPLIGTEPKGGETDTDAGVGGVVPPPVPIVICPTNLQFSAAGQLTMI